MEESKDGMWGQKIGIWAIVAVILVIAFLWFCHRQGEDKANLAASIQNLYGRVNTLEPVVADNVAVLRKVGNTLSATVQGVQCIKDDVSALDGAVFTSRCGRGGGCGCNDTRYIAKNNYTLAGSTLEQIETCGGC